MFIQSISAFEQEWKHESASTLKIFRALTDASLAQEVAPGHRKLGELAWHIVTTLQEMMSRTGLKFESPDEHTPQPSSAQAIADAYERASQALLEAVLGQWTDASLQEQVKSVRRTVAERGDAAHSRQPRGPSPRADDRPDASSRLEGARRLWACEGRMAAGCAVSHASG